MSRQNLPPIENAPGASCGAGQSLMGQKPTPIWIILSVASRTAGNICLMKGMSGL